MIGISSFACYAWPAAPAARLLYGNSCPLDHISPFVDIGLEPVEDFLGRAGLGLDAEIERAFL
jgi:hypothetical protein